MKLNEKQLITYAEKLGEKLRSGDIIVLTGDLGAGKTTFTKGLGRGLGISRMIKSPTYTIVREYDEGRLPLYHMDVYRIGDDPDSIDLDDYLFGDGVTVIEWGNLLGPDLPADYLEIVLEKDEATETASDNDAESRVLTLVPHGKGYEVYL
ncbi:tRNA (adenosine(37)-N6)-threonylcarbamoyltransferase complex ATPase subunit type 1 TsaE [Lactococcus insecticola]|uniref:tRNA threonylcarbamoyladenosine biosynthesis protein TsaE n=1 Tax=Pseudolactococcus insecticola TaxID=2709158 RepID=A0A6A0B5N7_9LACT|nr:tRNA (adenosine(37)-N6)-threonylcarbamoyltransferase complex ATPase subunit type 1 TsaE [Lactococcus insecticola]GFH40286.1 tRNA (adenosine(37)-N6)-threonylcarbamoyltransferase complex ATPase subunit type 1 TsaE [Lactococcus insecticola]